VSSGITKGSKKSPLSVAFQESELQFDDVPDFADEPAGSFLSLAQAPKLASANASVSEAPSTAARRASARSRTSKADAVVDEEAAIESVPDAPSTAARRAGARSRTPELQTSAFQCFGVSSRAPGPAPSSYHEALLSALTRPAPPPFARGSAPGPVTRFSKKQAEEEAVIISSSEGGIEDGSNFEGGSHDDHEEEV
jgi:hypothetical protein